MIECTDRTIWDIRNQMFASDESDDHEKELGVRTETLIGWDCYIRDAAGKAEIEIWNEHGVPDGADEWDLMQIADDDGLFQAVETVYGMLCEALDPSGDADGGAPQGAKQVA